MWFTIGFGAVMAVCSYFSQTLLLMIGVLFGLPGVGILILPPKYTKPILAILLGIGVGMAYYLCYEGVVLKGAKAYDGKEVSLQIEATDYAFATENRYIVDGKTQLEGRSYNLRLYYYEECSIKPGDLIRGLVTLRYTANGGIDAATYHKGEGIFLLGYAGKDMCVTACDQVPAKHFAAVLRKTITDRIDMLFPSDTAAFAKALLLGDDSDLGFEENLAFQRSGLRHVVAVSGLHVSILFSVLYFLTGRKKILTLLMGVPLLFVFAAVAGFSPSVVRACIMQGLVILAVAMDKEYDPGTALSFAVLVLLFSNPLAVTSVSFQLSVGCMVGIFLFSHRIRNYLYSKKIFDSAKGKGRKARLIRRFVGSVSVSVSAMSVTLPLCAVYFDTISVVGILSNLLVLWLITYVFIGIIVTSLLSWIWLPAGMVMGQLLSLPIRLIQWVARIMAAIPFGSLYTDNPYTLVFLAATGILLILLLLSKKKPVAWVATALTVFYLITAIVPWTEPYWGDYMMTVLDVGEGQCILLQSKDCVYMVDCGGNDGETAATVAIRALESRGIRKLDGVILTHYDVDHSNGLRYLLSWMEADALYLPDVEPENEIRMELEKGNVPIVWVDEEMTESWDKGEISLFPEETGRESNESSLCILFQTENCDILITGDRDQAGENRLLEQANIPNIEVLVAGHHGAATSCGTALLNATQPEIVVISVGENNRYRHPSGDTLKRLEAAGCIIRRTDTEGTIIIRG